MNYILSSIKAVIDQCQDVKIDMIALDKVCSQIKPKDIKNLENNILADFPKFDNDKDKIAFLFVQDAINFSFWGEPKWSVTHKNKQLGGFYSLLACLNRALKQNFPILDPKYLAKISKKDLRIILKANIIIPFFKERQKALQELGSVIITKFSSDFTQPVKQGQTDVLKLLKIIVANFSFFNDCTIYNNKKVYFYKRAQLLINEIHNVLDGKKLGEFKNIDELTSFADYKTPQVLRKFGILKYSPRLAKKVDNKIEIPASHPQEIEIRTAMVWAIELMRRKLKPKISQITSCEIDNYLWLLGQKKSPTDKPYHRTRTIYY